MKRRLVILLLVCLPLAAGAAPRLGAIATAHPLATAAGFEVLEAGGNAFDAAVAVSAALAVVEPSSSGMGGGGFWLLAPADAEPVFVDGRERAPGAAHADLYLDEQGEVDRDLALNGPLAAGIPGQAAALAHIAERHGSLPLARSLAPAIRLAREGFAVDAHYLHMAKLRAEALRRYPASATIFLGPDGAAPTGDFRLVQADLAWTLERLAQHGRAGFYEGEVARRLVQGVRAAGGIWTLDDLRDYRVIERAPLRGHYRDLEVITAPPPGSGTILLIALNILEGYDLPALARPQRRHLIIEAMRRAYRDRAEYLGDPDFTEVPLGLLLDDSYAAGLRAGIHPARATPSALLPGEAAPAGGTDTTHFSIADRDGNLVSATLSINIPFGSAFVPAGTGVLLNDEMDDFSAKPGAPNVYGLVGAGANAIAAGKRPLSSMSPTILRRGDWLGVLGTPGGSRIISMVLLGTLAAEQAPLEPERWVARKRFHHQYLPDQVQFEQDGLDAAEQEELQALGHELKMLDRRYGNMQAISWDRGSDTLRAAADPRRVGAAEVR